jgi:hypothetical protein
MMHIIIPEKTFRENKAERFRGVTARNLMMRIIKKR